MNRLLDIPIRIEAPTRTGGLGGGVLAVLTELCGLLDRLSGGGLPATIDLRSLPMSAADRLELGAALGDGEVQVVLNAGGISNIRETGVSGVWWIEHRDIHGELVAESLEVSRIPQILESSLEEISSSTETLRERLACWPLPSPTGMHHASRQ